MTNIILILILLTQSLLLIGSILLFVKLRHVYDDILASILDFIVPPSDAQPSKLAKAVDVACSMVARAITVQLKTTLMGMESGISRAMKGVEGDITEDMAGQTPLGGILQAFPKLSKTLRRNPQLLDLALGALSKIGGNSRVTSGNGEKPKFHL